MTSAEIAAAIIGECERARAALTLDVGDLDMRLAMIATNRLEWLHRLNGDDRAAVVVVLDELEQAIDERFEQLRFKQGSN